MMGRSRGCGGCCSSSVLPGVNTDTVARPSCNARGSSGVSHASIVSGRDELFVTLKVMRGGDVPVCRDETLSDEDISML